MVDRRPYQPPKLEPLSFAAPGKHLTPTFGSGADYDEAASPAMLLRQFGSPLYVASERRLRSLYRDFAAAFAAPGIDTRIAYSYKTNYLPAICRVLHQEGAAAEIVSGMEYALARSLGVPAREILFNGPYKRREDLERAIGEGAVVTLDGFDDLARVEGVVAATGMSARIGLRVNFPFGSAPWTRFGFADDTGESQAALVRLAANPRLNLELLHNHSGTFHLSPEVYARATDVLIDLARRARALGLAPTAIDLGGGFPSSNQPKPSWGHNPSGEDAEHRLAPFARVILPRIRDAAALFGGQPRLVLEPGRALVDAAVWLIATVVALKRVAGQGNAAVLDAGVNLVPTSGWYDHPVERGETTDTALFEPTTLYGPLCMQIDVLRDRVALPSLAVGDPLVIGNVGAYCHSQSMQFIQTRPATVLIGPAGPEIVRRAETWTDVFALDQVPSRLRADADG